MRDGRAREAREPAAHHPAEEPSARRADQPRVGVARQLVDHHLGRHAVLGERAGEPVAQRLDVGRRADQPVIEIGEESPRMAERGLQRGVIRR